MNKTSSTIFISDLHLQENHPHTILIFLQFLSNMDKKTIDAIYILGDLFETWVGDDDDTELHRKIIQALKSLTQQGLAVYFLCGNRDFLVGKRFLQETGCRLLVDETKINLYGNMVLLMHGDTLCTRDIAYIKARKKLRNPLLQKLFLLLPLKWRKKIASNMRERSMQHTTNTNLEMMDAVQSEIENVMQKHHVKYLIHGHTHRPGIHEFLLNQEQATRIVLGAWHQNGNCLKWDANGNKEIIEFS